MQNRTQQDIVNLLSAKVEALADNGEIIEAVADQKASSPSFSAPAVTQVPKRQYKRPKAVLRTGLGGLFGDQKTSSPFTKEKCDSLKKIINEMETPDPKIGASLESITSQIPAGTQVPKRPYKRREAVR